MALNIFDLPEFPLAEELLTVLAETDAIRIERVISAGHTTGWYDQEHSEFVVLLRGSAELEFEKRTLTMQKGDTVLIKPHEKHRVRHTSSEPPCVWICVFF